MSAEAADELAAAEKDDGEAAAAPPWRDGGWLSAGAADELAAAEEEDGEAAAAPATTGGSAEGNGILTITGIEVL